MIADDEIELSVGDMIMQATTSNVCVYIRGCGYYGIKTSKKRRKEKKNISLV